MKRGIKRNQDFHSLLPASALLIIPLCRQVCRKALGHPPGPASTRQEHGQPEQGQGTRSYSLADAAVAFVLLCTASPSFSPTSPAVRMSQSSLQPPVKSSRCPSVPHHSSNLGLPTTGSPLLPLAASSSTPALTCLTIARYASQS